jgi:predicted small metal-binding protein
MTMTFKLACGDVMPGCTARFETNDRDQLLSQVASHAARDHGITDITPEVLQAVQSQIVAA